MERLWRFLCYLIITVWIIITSMIGCEVAKAVKVLEKLL